MRQPRTLLLLLFACGDPTGAPEPDAALEPPVLAWSPCAAVTGGTDTRADCGEAEVPLDWSRPDGSRIHVFVKRIGDAAAATQMWMLNGGPGASGAEFDELSLAASMNGPVVFYLPDHRGTGRSTRIGCSAENDASPGGFAIVDSEWESCAADALATHGDDLSFFTTTQAAHDVVWMLEQTRREGQAINLWGGSYGTRLVQRALQLQPEVASSATMLGVVTADRHMADYDRVFDGVGRAFLARCGEDPFCASRLGSAAAERAQAIWSSIDTGHCAAAQIDKSLLRPLFAGLLLWSWEQRALIPATLYRIERCNVADVAALRYLRAVLMQPTTADLHDRLQSTLLGLNISANEFWPSDPPPLSELVADDERAIVSFGSSARVARRREAWHRYPLDEYAGRYPDTSVPVLLVNGEFDPATTANDARAVASHFTRPHQRLVIGPDATHSFTTPTSGGFWCFLALSLQFAQMPTSNASCANDMLPLDFHGTPDVAAFFGTTDLWDGGPTVSATVRPRGADDLLRRIGREVR